jgi:hypothetical protein
LPPVGARFANGFGATPGSPWRLPPARSAEVRQAPQEGKKKRAKKASAPLTGIYDACSMSEPKEVVGTCGERLAALGQGGFKVVLNYWTDGMLL